ncbi:DUF4019 domain-containing protein [Microbulbifer yueqingensis]|uniref:DUF4019 domain-containing protein n=1 Tax=Microbulbifer yueqingensis TaxID=658219 RepID=UPI00158779B3|nr:DUF4019 domain-containing protein [Microbulbifer yueqingensis]
MKGLVLALALTLPGPASAVDNPTVQSVLAWLEVIDNGAYNQSWESSAPMFRQQVTSEQWQEALEQARKPLGKVLSREVQSTSEHSSLPGAPDGKYLVVKLASSFENKARATETVTLKKVQGQWRAVGYFIK